MAEAQSILDTMVGKTIVAVTLDEKRIVVETDDGSRYNFYGLMGGGGPAPEAEPERLARDSRFDEADDGLLVGRIDLGERQAVHVLLLLAVVKRHDDLAAGDDVALRTGQAEAYDHHRSRVILAHQTDAHPAAADVVGFTA